MCGICGINWTDNELIKKMNESLIHRGPDKGDYYVDDFVSLGHRRLSIIDLSEKGNQPMSNEDGSIWVVFNGEIYNFKELKDKMVKKGHKFKSNTDTEAIIHSYEEFGINCLKYFNGMFAFALWDSKKKSLFLARDRIGIKPLYYYHKNNRFLFGSEIKAILQYDEVKRKVNVNSLDKFLSLTYFPDENTLFKDIYQLPPANYMILKDDSLEINSYWDLKFDPSSKTETEHMKDILETLKDSIYKRLIADVPLGAFLSGGLDSSTIVGIMSNILDKPVKTFSVGYNDPIDELNDAKVIAEHFNTDHTELIVEPKSFDILPQIIYHMDSPMADPVTLPTYLMSQLAKKHVTVVLSGEGPDELFGGYSWYKRAEQTQKLRKLIPNFIQKTCGIIADLPIDKYNNGKIKKRLEFISKIGNKAKTNIFFNIIFNDKKKSDLLQIKPKIDFIQEQNNKYFSNSLNYVDQVYYYYIKTFLPGQILTKTDRMSMAHGLEVRVPFLDHRLAEIASKIPYNYKMRGTTKYILRKTVKDLIPKHNIKKKKQGFSVPLNSWFGKELKDITINLLSESNSKQKFLNYKFVNHLLKKSYSKGKNYKFDRIWNLLCFEIWHRMYIESDLFNKKDIKLNDLM